jgi:hypothetical protein
MYAQKKVHFKVLIVLIIQNFKRGCLFGQPLLIYELRI